MIQIKNDYLLNKFNKLKNMTHLDTKFPTIVYDTHIIDPYYGRYIRK